MSKKKKDELILYGGSAGSGQIIVNAVLHSLETVSLAPLLEPEGKATKPERDSRFPIPQAEYDALKLAAEIPEPAARGIGMKDSADMDDGIDALLVETGEDGIPATAPGVLAPPTVASFDAIPATNLVPPDCHTAVGPNHVLVAANSTFQVYNKAGVALPTWFKNPISLYGSSLPTGAFVFDPRVVYDHYANRWVAIFAATRQTPTKGSWVMLSVSQTADPLGAWWSWALDFKVDGSTVTNNWGDYPTLGFDTQAFYITTNQFAFGGGFVYAKLRILSKAAAYSGGSLGWWDFWNLKNPDNSQVFSLQPCVHFRGTGGNPPGYLVNAIWANNNKLTVWTVNSPVTFASGGVAPSISGSSVACRAYSLPPQAMQLGSATKIATNDTRLLNAVFQHVGSTQRIWTTHTSAFTWSGDAAARAAINWYEIDVPTKTVIQQNTYGASGLYYFFPAIQTDFNRNAYIVFSRSGALEYGQVRQTGRKVADALNNLDGSALLKIGESPHNSGRWGDYFGICRDPADVLRVWCIGEYADSGGKWGTWVGSMKY